MEPDDGSCDEPPREDKDELDDDGINGQNGKQLSLLDCKGAIHLAIVEKCEGRVGHVGPFRRVGKDLHGSW